MALADEEEVKAPTWDRFLIYFWALVAIYFVGKSAGAAVFFLWRHW